VSSRMLFSDMTKIELQKQMKQLQQLGQAAFDQENWSEYEIHMTKWYLAKSYEMLPDHSVTVGTTYRIAEEYDRFTVTGFDGVMAWGIRESNAESDAIPLAKLEPYDDGFETFP
jgi:hypothetical protein